MVLKFFKKTNGQRNNQQSSLQGEKLEINLQLVFLTQMSLQIHLTSLHLFQNLSILPNYKGFCNQPLHHLANFIYLQK